MKHMKWGSMKKRDVSSFAIKNKEHAYIEFFSAISPIIGSLNFS